VGLNGIIQIYLGFCFLNARVLYNYKSHGLTASCFDLPQVASTYRKCCFDLPQVASTYRKLLRLTASCFDLPQVASTYRKLFRLTASCFDLPQVASTYRKLLLLTAIFLLFFRSRFLQLGEAFLIRRRLLIFGEFG
jgi:hypothetical protein